MDTKNQEPTEVEKKQDKDKTEGKPTISNLNLLFWNIFKMFIILLIIYFINGVGLYLIKIAQANLFHTDEYCFPYETTQPDFVNKTQAETNIFETFNNNNEPKSVFTLFKEFFLWGQGDKVSKKIFFPLTEKTVNDKFIAKFGTEVEVNGEKISLNDDVSKAIGKIYDLAMEALEKDPNDISSRQKKDYIENFYNPLSYNFSDFFPEWFVNIKKNTESSFLFGFVSTIEDVTNFASRIQSSLYNLLGKLPEQFVYHLYFPAMMFFNLIVLLVFPFYTVFRSVINLKYFLKKKDTSYKSDIESDKWREVSGISYFWGLCLLFFFAFALGFLCFMTTHVVTFILFASVYFGATFMRSFIINPENKNEQIWGAYDTAKEAFFENKHSVILVFVLFALLLPTFAHMGPMAGISTTLVLLLIYILSMFNHTESLGPALSVLVPKEQVIKKCNAKPNPAPAFDNQTFMNYLKAALPEVDTTTLQEGLEQSEQADTTNNNNDEGVVSNNVTQEPTTPAQSSSSLNADADAAVSETENKAQLN